MIEAAQFVEAARARGFDRYAGVPCSYLTPFINYVIQSDALQYVNAANEGDAVAISAGAALGGKRAVTMMQNSGLGNAVSPLTSLTWTFALPQLLIVTWRGEPGVADEPQHALMGPITPQMLDTMDVPWELFPRDAGEIEAVLDRATAHMDRTGRPYALLMKKGSVAPFSLQGTGAPVPRPFVAPRQVLGDRTLPPVAVLPSRTQALERIVALAQARQASTAAPGTPTRPQVLLASTGFTGRELYALGDRENQLYMVGSMGCIATLALGLSLARPDLDVVAIDGDGAALMRLSAFATVGAYGPANLFHLLLDNGAHDSTGGQATVSSGVGFADIAAACGYPCTLEGDDLDVFDTVMNEVAASNGVANSSVGARFARLRTRPGSPADLPRPKVTPVQVRERLQAFIGLPA